MHLSVETLPPHAQALIALYRRLEYTLRRNGYVRKDRAKAHIDWALFAKELGGQFFDEVANSGKAALLIAEPPRIYYREKGMLPEIQTPITDVEQLFVRGVCQVRNNIDHGEKFVSPANARDHILTKEALWVLEQAVVRHSKVNDLLAAPLDSVE